VDTKEGTAYMPAHRRTFKRYFTITNSMLAAGEAAMRNCREAGGHTPRTACQAIFQAMLNAADSHPGAVYRPNTHGNVWARYPQIDIWLDGKRLPRRIYHPERLPVDVIRSRYWYLRDCYRKELLHILADPKKVAVLEFIS
jgi:hypothetical protein